MERNLKDKIKDFLNSFNAKEVNEYFANDFDSDWDNYLKSNIPTKVLEYLNDSFIDIDINYRETEYFDKKVKETLETALKMIDCN